MKIVFVDQFSEFGGAQIGLRDLLDETLRRGWQAEVLAPGGGPLRQACLDRGIPFSHLPLAHYANGHKTPGDIFRYGLDCARAGRVIRQAAQRLNADLVYVNGPRALPAAVHGVDAEGPPIVFHAHSYLDREYTRRIARWCVARRTMHVIAISRFVAQPFSGMTGIPRMRVFYNGVQDHGFVARPRPRPSRIGIIGRIAVEKGHVDFVRAAKSMAIARPDLRFSIFGAALFSGREYEAAVSAAAEGAPVEFRGWTDDVAAALHEIDVLAVPSGPAEGATRVIMEAFSAGTPVVAYPSGGIPELVRHGETGLLTQAREHVCLAASLTQLLDDSSLMARLSSQGREAWETRFRLHRCQLEICDYVRDLVTSRQEFCESGLTATSGTRSEPMAPEAPDDAARVAR